MGITGRYNFTGIQKLVTTGVNTLLASTSWGVWLLASPFKPVLQALEDAAVNFLVNRGLIIIDIGAVVVDGQINEDNFNTALTNAFNQLRNGRDQITPTQGAKIDADTTAAFDKFADVNATDAATGSVPDVPDSSL